MGNTINMWTIRRIYNRPNDLQKNRNRPRIDYPDNNFQDNYRWYDYHLYANEEKN